MKNISIQEYFSFEEDFFFPAGDVVDNLTEEFILEGENYLDKNGIDRSNIYFKLLGQLNFLKSNTQLNHSSLAHAYYIMAYYVGLFLHPLHGDDLALMDIQKAIELESNADKI